ncbi:hypothetical protein H2203_004324 [Taxawa tesnikishii (nom. ined.)]|nr:hypothetical protein H2203_004324 [Dothideales sp. JES 119]
MFQEQKKMAAAAAEPKGSTGRTRPLIPRQAKNKKEETTPKAPARTTAKAATSKRSKKEGEAKVVKKKPAATKTKAATKKTVEQGKVAGKKTTPKKPTTNKIMGKAVTRG